MADLSTTICGIDFTNPVMPAAGPERENCRADD